MKLNPKQIDGKIGAPFGNALPRMSDLDGTVFFSELGVETRMIERILRHPENFDPLPIDHNTTYHYPRIRWETPNVYRKLMKERRT